MKLKGKILRHKEEKYRFGHVIHGKILEEYDLPTQVFSKSLNIKDLEILVDNPKDLQEYELVKIKLEVYE